jgi:hypothetical protein
LNNSCRTKTVKKNSEKAVKSIGRPIGATGDPVDGDGFYTPFEGAPNKTPVPATYLTEQGLTAETKTRKTKTHKSPPAPESAQPNQHPPTPSSTHTPHPNKSKQTTPPHPKNHDHPKHHPTKTQPTTKPHNTPPPNKTKQKTKNSKNQRNAPQRLGVCSKSSNVLWFVVWGLC